MYAIKLWTKTRPRFAVGSIPAGWSTLKTFRSIDLSSNNFTGTLPPSWSSLTNAQYLNFSANYLDGTVPGVWRNSSTGNGTIDSGLTSLSFMYGTYHCRPKTAYMLQIVSVERSHILISNIHTK